MHDLVQLFGSLAVHLGHYLLYLEPTPVTTPSSGGGGDSTIKVALVTTVGIVIAAAITAIASTFKREPSKTGTVTQNEVFTKQYINSLERDRKELSKLREIYGHLREACLERGLDPDAIIREQREQES